MTGKRERWVFVGRVVNPVRLVWQRIELPGESLDGTYYSTDAFTFWNPRRPRAQQ